MVAWTRQSELALPRVKVVPDTVHVPAVTPNTRAPLPEPPAAASVIVSPKIALDGEVIARVDWVALAIVNAWATGVAEEKFALPT